MSGGALASGGSFADVVSGVGQAVKGAVGQVGSALGSVGSDIVGAVGSKARDMYHGLMSMHQHDWEAVREAASQNLGNGASSMWGAIPSAPFKRSAHHVMSVARAHSPHIAAKLLEAEHAQVGEGGGFHDALQHFMGAVTSHVGGAPSGAGPLVNPVQPFLGVKRALSGFPLGGGLGPLANPVQPFLGVKRALSKFPAGGGLPSGFVNAKGPKPRGPPVPRR